MTAPFDENVQISRAAHVSPLRAATAAIRRRQVVRGLVVAGAAGLGYSVLTACGDGDSGTGGTAPGGEQAIAAASEIPVGGGKVFEEQEVVVTQPSKGAFQAFSAVCTHRGCTVDRVQNKLIHCPCHGSITDASVQDGPAPEPLPSYEVRIQDGQVVIG